MSNVRPGSQAIIEQAQALCRQIAELPVDEAVEVLNAVRSALHEVSPMRQEPVDLVLWVPSGTVAGNAYNPNRVALPEMRLLKHSIRVDGYTQPIVTWPLPGNREIVDGFHRHLAEEQDPAIRRRVKGYLPVTTINPERDGIDDRMAATIRHNRARGKAGVENMSQIVLDLSRRNRSESWIARELGMEPDEVLRLLQTTGLAEAFRNREFSQAWEVADEQEAD